MGGTAKVPSETGMLSTACDSNLACKQPQQSSQLAWLARPDPTPPPTPPHVPGCSRRRAANTLAAPCRFMLQPARRILQNLHAWSGRGARPALCALQHLTLVC